MRLEGRKLGGLTGVGVALLMRFSLRRRCPGLTVMVEYVGGETTICRGGGGGGARGVEQLEWWIVAASVGVGEDILIVARLLLGRFCCCCLRGIELLCVCLAVGLGCVSG